MSTTTEADDPRSLSALTRRSERFLRAVDHYKRPLNRRESFHLQCFLGYLRKGQWEEADAALSRAEQVAPIPARFAGLPSTNELAGTADLRAQLAQIIGDT